jgi:Fur family ferric uptake transcriptional regulator
MPQKRNTPQRKIIESVLNHTKQPLFPEEVLALAQKEQPSLGIATVYRTLKDLTEEGVVHKVCIRADSTRYEGLRNHHHHFKCINCDNVFDLFGCPGNFEKLLPADFELIDHDITLFGQCASCKKSH